MFLIIDLLKNVFYFRFYVIYISWGGLMINIVLVLLIYEMVMFRNIFLIIFFCVRVYKISKIVNVDIYVLF